MTKVPTPTKKSKKKNIVCKHKNATKHFDYTTIANQLRTVSLSNENRSTVVVKPVYGIPTFPLTAKALYTKGYTLNKDKGKLIVTRQPLNKITIRVPSVAFLENPLPIPPRPKQQQIRRFPSSVALVGAQLVRMCSVYRQR